MWSRGGSRLISTLALSLMLPATLAAQTTVVSQNCLHLGWGKKTQTKADGFGAANLSANADVMVFQEVMPKGGADGLSKIVVKMGGIGTYTPLVSTAYGKGSYREFYGFVARNTFAAGGVTETPAAAAQFSRPPNGVRITPPNGSQFWLLNYHAVFGKNIGVRQAEVRQMINVVNGFNAVQSLKTLMGGDWNLPTTDAAFTPLTTAGYLVNPNVLTSLNPSGALSSAYDHFAWGNTAAVANPQVLPPLMTNQAWRLTVSDHLGIQCQLQ